MKFRCERYPRLVVWDPKSAKRVARFSGGELDTTDRKVQALVQKIPEAVRVEDSPEPAGQEEAPDE